MSEAKVPGPCLSCGRTTEKKCAKCKAAFYCCRDCQEEDWKDHKRHCFPPGSTCTRCQQDTISRSLCFVPHPGHLVHPNSATYSSNGSRWDFHCLACSSRFTKSSSVIGEGYDSAPITLGKKWCFVGLHTVKPLRPDFQSRVWPDAVVLSTSDQDLEAKIKALDGNTDVRVLKIKSSDGMDDHDKQIKFSGIRMPNLEEFHSENVYLTHVELTTKTTPKIHTISIQNMPDEANCNIECPELKKCTFQFWGPGDEEWVHKMLKCATKLEYFDSYKFRVSKLVFASNHLKKIRLHRAELMSHLEIWAPKLVSLNVQACYDLDSIQFLKTHPLKKDLPENFSCSLPLSLDVENACLGQIAIQALSEHPRVDSRKLSEDLEKQENMFW